jgi:ParB/RepB/Spo0J family partition protein
MAPKSKLTIEQIGKLRIRAAETPTPSQTELAAEFGISRALVRQALGSPLVEGAGAAGQAPPGFTQSIPAELLLSSPVNPRKTFEPEALQELAYSIATNGLMQNLVVRPMEEPEGRYQIVAGERRFRAITQLIENGQWEGPIPCLVKDFSEGEQLAIALLENLQRENIPPLEEAEGFAALHAMDADLYSAANIAETIGKSTRYVYQRLALATKVIPQVKELFKRGLINIEGARLLAQVKQEWQRDILFDMEFLDDETGAVLDELEIDSTPVTPEDIQNAIQWKERAEKHAAEQEAARAQHREHNATLDAQSSPSASGPINPNAGDDEDGEEMEKRIERQNPDPPKSQPVTKAHIYHAHNRKTEALRHELCKHHYHAARVVCFALLVPKGPFVNIRSNDYDRTLEDRVPVAADHEAAIKAILGKIKIPSHGGIDAKMELALMSFLGKLPAGQVMKLFAHLVARHVGTFAGARCEAGDDPVTIMLADALGLHGQEEEHGLGVEPEDLKGVRKQTLLAIADESGTPRINDELKPQEIADAIAAHTNKYVLPTLRFATTAEIEKALTFK